MDAAGTGRSREPTGSPRRVDPWVLAGVCALSLAVLAPVLRRGFALSYDMVGVPDQSLSASALGATDAPPRAVPVDAAVAVLDQVVPGELLQKVLLVAILVAAGWGAARAVVGCGRAAQAVAAAVYLWNPFVAERLTIGHWSLLAAYAAQPWLLVAAAGLRDAPTRARAGALVVGLGVAGLTPGGLVIDGVLVLTVLAWPGGLHRTRRVVCAAAAVVVLALPWLLAGAVSGPWLHPRGATEAAVDVFASRSENVLGLPGTLLGLGGIWNADVVPGSRTLAGGLLGLLWTTLVVALAATGASRLAAHLGRPTVRATAAAAGAGLVVAVAGATPGVRWVLVRAIDAVPALGLLRDGQRWLMAWALLLALAAGAGAARLARAVPDRDQARAVVVAVLVVLVALLPDLGYGVAGRVQAWRYPADWAEVSRALDRDHHPGSVVVLPYAAFRAFRFTGGRTVLDPAPRYLSRVTVTDDRLVVGGTTVPGESRVAAAAGAALADPDPARRSARLRELGVGWALVETDQPGAVPALGSSTTVVSGRDLRLVRLDGEVRSRRAHDVALLAAAHAVWGAAILLALLGLVARRGTRRTGSGRPATLA